MNLAHKGQGTHRTVVKKMLYKAETLHSSTHCTVPLCLLNKRQHNNEALTYIENSKVRLLDKNNTHNETLLT